MSHTRAALIAAAAAVALAGCSKPKPAATASQPLTVSVAKVEVRSLQSGLVASGVLVSREEAGVAPELSGYRVSDVYVDEGDLVTKGQPLAKLDDTLLRAQIDQSKANLAQQQVAADRADAEAARVAGLDNQGVLSEEQIAERRLAGRSAHAAVAVAQAQLNDLDARDARMTIRAPVSGRVLERTARPGDTSAPGTPLFRIARDQLIELNAEVPEAQLGGIHIGDHADVELASGAHVPGTVRFISPRIDPTTKLGEARIALPIRPYLRPGGFARARFAGASRAVPAAPEQAIRYDADGASTMVVGPDNRVRRASVRTGARAGGWVELVEGPPPGSRVALGGSAFVLEGDQVRVAPASGVAAPSGASAQ